MQIVPRESYSLRKDVHWIIAGLLGLWLLWGPGRLLILMFVQRLAEQQHLGQSFWEWLALGSWIILFTFNIQALRKHWLLLTLLSLIAATMIFSLSVEPLITPVINHKLCTGTMILE